VLGCWGAGVLGCWGAGVLGCWGAGCCWLLLAAACCCWLLLAAGCWLLGAGWWVCFWVLLGVLLGATGCWVLGAGCWVLGAVCSGRGARHRPAQFGFSTLAVAWLRHACACVCAGRVCPRRRPSPVVTCRLRRSWKRSGGSGSSPVAASHPPLRPLPGLPQRPPRRRRRRRGHPPRLLPVGESCGASMAFSRGALAVAVDSPHPPHRAPPPRPTHAPTPHATGYANVVFSRVCAR
jgi:hypothetical protein